MLASWGSTSHSTTGSQAVRFALGRAYLASVWGTGLGDGGQKRHSQHCKRPWHLPSLGSARCWPAKAAKNVAVQADMQSDLHLGMLTSLNTSCWQRSEAAVAALKAPVASSLSNHLPWHHWSQTVSLTASHAVVYAHLTSLGTHVMAVCVRSSNGSSKGALSICPAHSCVLTM